MKETMKAPRIVPILFAIILATAFPAWSFTTPTLRDELTGNQIGEGTRNLVICIHGWNNPPNPNRYTEYEWAALVAELKIALPKTGSDPWALLPYHWEDDANTGGVFGWPNPYQDNAVANANTAAAFAWQHGDSLGPRLPLSLRRVHIIAHSAGAWAARQTALSVLENNRFVVVQVTLLDPYVPDSVLPHSYNDSKLNDLALADFLYSGRVSLLENYYADDSLIGGWNSTMMPAPTLGTQDTFVWRGNDINQRVDWGPIIVAPPGARSPLYQEHYDWHSGPIYFYADTLSAAAGYPPASLPTGSPFNYQQRGWYRSLYYRTQQGQLPRITTQPVGQSSTESSVILSVTASGSGPFIYQWFKNNSLIIGANNSTHAVNSSTDPPTPYVVRVTDANGNHFFSDRAVVTFYSAPPPQPTAPSIASVLPSTLTGQPLPQTQLLRIIGSGFTSSSTLLFNGSIASDPARLYFISANEIDYYVRTDTIAANWTVKVINGAQQSNLGYFTVIASTPNTGSLTVNLSPAGAVSAGAQWRVDGGSYRNSGDTATGLTPGSHTVSFKAVAGYTAPADHTVTITGGAVANDSGTYTAVTASTYTLTLNQGGSMGSISASPFGTWNGSAYVYTAGSVVQLTASANPGYHFVGWGGDVTGTANPAAITISGNKSVTANFASGDPNMGTVIVTIQPPAAAAAGVTWGWNANDYRASGTAVTTWPGTYILTVHPVDGWLGQGALFATITAGQASNYTVTFTQDTTPGLLTVTLSPPDAVTGGAKWHVNGGAAQGNGATVSLPPGNSYTLTFDPVPGWTAPLSQTVAVQRAQTTVVAGNYTPPAGKPVVGNIYPPKGPMTGGTLLTINGVSFTAPAAVLIGGQPASNVTVTSESQITCFSPPSSVYGSASVTVQTASGSATNLNGFAYGVGLGNKLDLVSSMGGSAFAVAVQGNYAYVGEGRTLLVLDISTPSSPSRIGRVLLPGVVMDVALLGQYAYVANSEGGLQVVDVSNPTVPVVRGFFATTNYVATQGIAILGGRAYVADGFAGLQIFDLGNPVVPMLLSSTNCGGGEAVKVKASSGGVLAYLSTGGSLCVIDVSQPLSPGLLGQVSMGSGGIFSIAVLGNYVFGAAAWDGGVLHMVDVSNPASPIDLRPSTGDNGTGGYVAVGAGNNYLYAESSVRTIGLKVFSVSGSSLTKVGQTVSAYADGIYNKMVVSASRAYIAAGGSGLQIVDIANPYSPSLLAAFTDSGQYGNYGSVGMSGNFLCACMGDFKVFDVSQPSQPTLVGQLGGRGATRVVVGNGKAYFTANNNVDIVDFSTPNAPHLVANIPNSVVYGYRLALSGSTLYVVGDNTSYQPRFVAVDVSNASAPTVRATKDFTALGTGLVRCVGVGGNRAVVGIRVDSGTPQLTVLDVSNVSAPLERGSLTNLGLPIDVRVSANGNYAYALANDLLRVVDISSPASPVVTASISVDSSTATSLELRGSELYVATSRGLYVFDVSNPSSPILTRNYSMSYLILGNICAPSDSPSQADNIFLADGDGGVVCLKEQDIQAPDIYITNPTFSTVYTNATSSVSLGGGASDNVGVTRVVWSNSRGGGGDADGTDSWFVSGVALQPGTNLLTVTAFDKARNSGSDTLAVIYQAPKQSQAITFPAVADHTFGDAPIPLAAAASSGLPVGFSVVSGAASLSNSVLTLTGAGSVTVRATQPGNAQFNAAPPVDVSFAVTQAGQGITFGMLASKPVGAAPFALSATASSGLPVAFSIVSGPAVLNSNVVTLTGAGAITVRASQPGNSNYAAAASVDRSFEVTKTAQFITFGPLSRQTLGDAPFPLAASASSGLPVSFSLLAGPAVLSGSVVTVTNTGLVVVRASQSGDGVFAPAPSMDQVLIVVPGNNVITDFQRLVNGMFTLRFYGEAGTVYVLMASTNLMNWLPLATNQINGLGYLEFTDTSSTNFDRRFYRIAP